MVDRAVYADRAQRQRERCEEIDERRVEPLRGDRLRDHGVERCHLVNGLHRIHPGQLLPDDPLVSRWIAVRADDETVPAEPWKYPLRIRGVDRRRFRLVQAVALHVRDNAHDGQLRGVERRDVRGPADTLPDRIRSWPEPVRGGFVDDDDGEVVLPVVFGEDPAANQRNPKQGEVVRAHGPVVIHMSTQ